MTLLSGNLGLLTYLVLLHFGARRANHSHQVSPSGSVVGKMLGLGQCHVAFFKVLGYDIQPAGAGGTSWSSPAGLLGVEGQDDACRVFHGQTDNVAVPADSPHCCESGCWWLLSFIPQCPIRNVLAPRDAFDPPEGSGVKAIKPGLQSVV